MVKNEIEIIRASVGHQRFWPKNNSFKYQVFYLKIPVTKNDQLAQPVLFSINKWNVFSKFYKDHGYREKGKNWHEFITKQLMNAKIPYGNNYSVSLITHPRIFGYAFNPISFWLISDNNDDLKAVLCEVTSTFKQTHNYLLSNADNSTITSSDVFLANKKLYVSPFNKIEGHYEFSFTYTHSRFKSVINYYDSNERHILNTYVAGKSEALSSVKILQSIILYPAMTLMVVFRIHWQAVRLYAKKVKHTTKAIPRDYKNNETTASKR